MWLRTVACGLLLLLFQVQGETSAGGDRDQSQICHTVQRHSLRLGAEGLQEGKNWSSGLMPFHNLPIIRDSFEEKKIKFTNFQTKRTGRINHSTKLCFPMSERKCPPFKGEFRG
jgi:hypothetical protein